MKKMMKVFSFVLTLVMICSLVFVLADTNDVHAAESTYTITYDANGGEFADGSTTNQMTYDNGNVITKVAHSENVDDLGVQNGSYSTNLQDKQVVTIPGAEKLHVTLTYETYSLDYDVIYVIPGEYTGAMNSTAGQYGQIAKVGGVKNTVEYDIDGDTVTFGFRSSNVRPIGSKDFYGYYAVVTSGSTDIVSGEYKEPMPFKGKSNFIGWYDAPYGGNEVHFSVLSSDTTVYAHYDHVTVTYDANGGQFANGEEINQLMYKITDIGTTKNAHSDNVNDEGVQNGSYSTNACDKQVVTIPGAERLYITITRQTNPSYDHLYIIPGDYQGDLNNIIDQRSTGGSRKETVKYEIIGDTVTFVFRTGSEKNDYYGYYAEVTGEDVSLIAGQYEEPISSDNTQNFVDWYDDPNQGIIINDTEIFQDTTVYAHYNGKYTITYDANGGQFADGSTLNVMTYGGERVVNSGNFDDSGAQQGGYSKSDDKQVITIPGAEKLHIKLTYQLGRYADKLCIVSGKYEGLFGGYNYPSERNPDVIAELPEDSYARKTTVEYDIPGDTVTFTFHSSYGSDRYGYYATVNGAEIVSGDYKEPTFADPYDDFEGWYDAPTGGNKVDVTQVHEDMTLYAQPIHKTSSYSVTFDANGGHFADGNTINQVGYENNLGQGLYRTVKYAHTPNVDDNGIQHGRYSSDLSDKQIVTIPNAEALHVVIKHNINGSSFSSTWNSDGLFVIPGAYPWDITGNYNSYGQIGSVYGNNSEGLLEYDIPGDTVTFGFRSFSRSNNTGSGYGYYAIITAKDEVSSLSEISGAYEVPVYQDEYGFDGWYDAPTGGNKVDLKTLEQNATVYAHWSTDAYAIIYTDGEMVFQRGSYPDDGRAVREIYTNFENSNFSDSYSVPWQYNGGAPNIALVTKVTFKDEIHPVSTMCWFDDFRALTDIDLTKLNTSNVTNMSNMFANCESLSSLDLSSFNTSNVTNMSYMFGSNIYGHPMRLETIEGLSEFDTSKVTNMSNMFRDCSSLTSIDVTEWNTSAVTYMSSMFNGCTSLENIDLTNFNTSNVKYMQFMFSGCSTLESIDVSRFVTSNVTDMSYMFDGCKALQTLDLSSWNTSKVTNMSEMFSGCSSLESLDLSGWNTSSATRMKDMFAEDYSLSTVVLGEDFHFKNSISDVNYQALLNTPGYRTESKVAHSANVDDAGVSHGRYETNLQDKQVVTIPGAEKLHVKLTYQTYNIDYVYVIPGEFTGNSLYGSHYIARVSGTTKKTVEYDIDGDTVTFGFSTNNVSSNNYGYYAEVTGVMSTFPYTGKWILAGDETGESAKTPEEMRDADTVTPGTWIWQIDAERAMIHYETNGGYVPQAEVFLNRDLLAEGYVLSEPTRLHYTFDGWTLNADGEGTRYQAGDVIHGDVAPLGAVTTFYAQWLSDPLRDYKVMHYQQNISMNGYSLVETENLRANVDTEVSPAVKQYDGFIIPEVQTATILDDDSLVISYYYDRVTYEVAFDGNGATSGFMANQLMVGGVSYDLPENTFANYGCIFTGWNTEPDGSGTAYTNGAQVMNLATVPGSVVTLYAQWMGNPNPALEPSAGKVTVTGKAGQTIVIPDLPDGTTYEIKEVLDSDIWEYEGMDNGAGVIAANVISRAGVDNRYHAEGNVPLTIYKSVIDSVTGNSITDFEAGDFSFSLQRYYGRRWQTYETSYNEAPDMNETTMNDNDEIIDNAHYMQAPVHFSALSFTQNDIGRTYEYRIMENRTYGNYEAQNRYLYFTVTVNDAGHGMLDFDVQFRDDIDTITNIKYPGHGLDRGIMMFEKSVVGAYPEDSEFTFNVRIFDDDNHDYDGQIRYMVGSGDILNDAETIREDVWQSGTPITIGANQFVVLRGGPVGMHYEITEVEQDGWMLLESTKTTGDFVTVKSDEDAMELANNHAMFINAFQADGSLNLEATKEMVGRSLDYGEFTFVVEDEDGNIISRGENDADGKIVFEPIPYTNDDVGNTYAYTVREVIPDYQAGGVTYSDTVYDITVDVVLEKGVLKAVPSENAQNMVFTNTYTAADTSITLDGSKILVGRELKDSDKWTFTISGDGPLPAETSVEVTPLNDDTFSFTIPFTQADLDGESEKTFTYTISESGFVPFVKNDSAKTVTIRLSDDGEGNLRAEVLRASSDDLTFVNHANVLLPATGSMTAILVSIAGVALMATGFVFYRKKRGTNAA